MTSFEDPMVRIEQVHKSLGGKEVLRGISLEIPRSETTVIMGPSGCGKSVLLKHIIGLMRPDSGRIWVDGEEASAMSLRELNRLRQKMGTLFQSAALFDSMTVAENVAFMLRQHRSMTRSEIASEVAKALEMVDLAGAEKLKPAELSGGMRKRVGLARAVVMRPTLILYDEPTTGLDPITARGINNMIRDMHERLGATSIVVTHDVESALSVGGYFALTQNGQIVMEGSPREALRSDNPLALQFFHPDQYVASLNKDNGGGGSKSAGGDGASLG